MGKIRVFEVQFDGEHPVVYSGQVLHGKVLLDLARSTELRCIKLHILGCERVFWSHGCDIIRAEKIYIKSTLVLFAQSSYETQSFLAGYHQFPFACQIPPDCPSSSEHQYGYVRFTCKAIMDWIWSGYETMAAFTVIRPLDLNTLVGGVSEPLQYHQSHEVTCYSCVSGDVDAKFMLSKQAFVPGEMVHFQAEIHNRSNTHVNGSSCSLIQHVQCFGNANRLSSSSKPRKVTNKLVVVVKQRSIPAGQSNYWTGAELLVPPLPASEMRCSSIINVSYKVKFKVSLNYGEDIIICAGITIGTIPLVEPIQRPSVPDHLSDELTAPFSDELPELLPYEPPPPSYEECISGQVDIRDERDSRYMMGQTSYAPIYPVYDYNDLSPPSYEEPRGQDMSRF